MNRRGFLTGVAGLLAAPAIVRAGSLMPVKSFPEIGTHGFTIGDKIICYDPGAGDEMAIVWRVVDTYTPEKPVLFWGPIPEAAYAS